MTASDKKRQDAPLRSLSELWVCDRTTQGRNPSVILNGGGGGPQTSCGNAAASLPPESPPIIRQRGPLHVDEAFECGMKSEEAMLMGHIPTASALLRTATFTASRCSDNLGVSGANLLLLTTQP
jgi:hypothetical protein